MKKLITLSIALLSFTATAYAGNPEGFDNAFPEIPADGPRTAFDAGAISTFIAGGGATIGGLSFVADRQMNEVLDRFSERMPSFEEEARRNLAATDKKMAGLLRDLEDANKSVARAKKIVELYSNAKDISIDSNLAIYDKYIDGFKLQLAQAEDELEFAKEAAKPAQVALKEELKKVIRNRVEWLRYNSEEFPVISSKAQGKAIQYGFRGLTFVGAAMTLEGVIDLLAAAQGREPVGLGLTALPAAVFSSTLGQEPKRAPAVIKGSTFEPVEVDAEKPESALAQ